MDDRAMATAKALKLNDSDNVAVCTVAVRADLGEPHPVAVAARGTARKGPPDDRGEPGAL